VLLCHKRFLEIKVHHIKLNPHTLTTKEFYDKNSVDKQEITILIKKVKVD